MRIGLVAGGGFPRGKLVELVNGGFGFFDKPVDSLAGAVVAEAVLDVVELDGGVGGEADAAVPRPLGGADLAVAIFPAGGPDNVTALHLHDLAAGVPQAQSRRLTVVVGLFHLALHMFDVFPQRRRR